MDCDGFDASSCRSAVEPHEANKKAASRPRRVRLIVMALDLDC